MFSSRHVDHSEVVPRRLSQRRERRAQFWSSGGGYYNIVDCCDARPNNISCDDCTKRKCDEYKSARFE